MKEVFEDTSIASRGQVVFKWATSSSRVLLIYTKLLLLFPVTPHVFRWLRNAFADAIPSPRNPWI
jgi:hypothetical protein